MSGVVSTVSAIVVAFLVFILAALAERRITARAAAKVTEVKRDSEKPDGGG